MILLMNESEDVEIVVQFRGGSGQSFARNGYGERLGKEVNDVDSV